MAVTMLALFALSNKSLGAVTLDFEDLSTSPGGGVSKGSTLVDSGFLLTAVTPNVEFSGYEDGWQLDRGSSNASAYVGIFVGSGDSSSFTIESTGALTFDLLSIDLAEVVNNGDNNFRFVARTVSFIGQFSGGGIVSQTFMLDLLSDGSGREDDFETVILSPDFSNLLSVTVTAASGQTNATLLAFDNIVLNESVPEPSSALLLLTGALGLTAIRRRTS